MSDINPTPAPQPGTDSWLEAGKTNVQVVYVLYIAGMFIGVSALIGLVVAYINRGKGEAWVDTHYTWQIRTFWIGLLYSMIALLLVLVAVGVVLMVAVAIWVIVRCVLGLQAAGRNQPMPNPNSWLI